MIRFSVRKDSYFFVKHHRIYTDFYYTLLLFVVCPHDNYRVSGFSRLVCACKSRIKCYKSVHEEPDVSHAPKLGPESFYLGIE